MTQYKAVAPHSLPAASPISMIPLRLCAVSMAMVLAACATKPATPDSSVENAGSVLTASADPQANLPRNIQPVQDLNEASAGADYGLRSDAPLRYVVKKGDTLWGIANRYLADAWQWPELWYVNGKLANPHKIYPGDVLELYNVNGRTVLARGEDLERLSPQIRESGLGDGLQAIPIDAIRNFLNGPRVVDIDQFNRAPYILDFADEHIIGGANMAVFIKNLPADNTASNFSTVRRGVTYKDPDTGELLGYEAIPSGEAEIRTLGNPAEAMLTSSRHEILAGDRLLPPESENFQANFYPHAPKADIDGKIISVYQGVSQITQYQIVALNRGSKHGLEPGHVLRIKQAPRKVRDPVTGKSELLPEVESGLLMIFKAMPGLSYGLIMDANRSIRVLDRVVKPVPGSLNR